MRHLILLPLLALSAPAVALDADAHRAEIDAWHAKRVERLNAPDGWLSLVGLHWVEPGTHRVGHGADNDIVLATGPERLGTITLIDGELTFVPDPASGVAAPAAGADRFEIEPGRSSMQFLVRGERRALRVRDAEATTRKGFVGIERFPVDLAWRVEARFEPNPAGTTVEIVDVTGLIQAVSTPGTLHFAIDGKPFSLLALEGGDDELFLIVADRTSGRESYGAGRFIYVPKPVEGRTVIDFNRLYNPPCAFTRHSTCPLPPPENRLDLAITAGEKRYRGPTE